MVEEFRVKKYFFEKFMVEKSGFQLSGVATESSTKKGPKYFFLVKSQNKVLNFNFSQLFH